MTPKDAEALSVLRRAQDGCPLARELVVMRGMCACRGDDAAVAEAETEYLRLTARLRAAEGLAVAAKECENALADYVPTLERQGAIMGYGNHVLRQVRAALAEWEKSK